MQLFAVGGEGGVGRSAAAVCGKPDDGMVRRRTCVACITMQCRGAPESLQSDIDAYAQPADALRAQVQWPPLTQLHVAGWPSWLGVEGGVEVLLDGRTYGVVDNTSNGLGRHLVLDIAGANGGPLQCGTSLELRWRSVGNISTSVA